MGSIIPLDSTGGLRNHGFAAAAAFVKPPCGRSIILTGQLARALIAPYMYILRGPFGQLRTMPPAVEAEAGRRIGALVRDPGRQSYT